MEIPRTCMDCGEKLHGRTDKKFCDDQCRSHFNNLLKADERTPVKQINRILLTNRKILEKLNPSGKTRINKNRLEKAGFNFVYFTHLYETQKGNTYKFCYDLGYLLIENNWYLLVKAQGL